MEAPPKAPREYRQQDINATIVFHGSKIGRIQVWRRVNRGRPGVWMHIGRYRPGPDLLGWIEHCFGGGRYRVKLLARWLPDARREPFLQQVTFSISGQPSPYIERRLALRERRAARA